jgi:hypothetical protein
VSSLSLVSLCNALLVVDLLLVVCLIKVVNVWWEMTLVGNNDPRFFLSWPIGSRFLTLEVAPVRSTCGLLPSESPLIVSFWLFSRVKCRSSSSSQRDWTEFFWTFPLTDPIRNGIDFFLIVQLPFTLEWFLDLIFLVNVLIQIRKKMMIRLIKIDTSASCVFGCTGTWK